MLRIGVIGEASELVKLCASIEAIEEVHFIGFHSVDELGFENTHARFTSIEELLLATDSVYVSSKAASREGVLEKAIRGQIHTLVEFPFIIDSEVASDLMNLAHEANIKLQVGNPLKFTPVRLKPVRLAFCKLAPVKSTPSTPPSAGGSNQLAFNVKAPGQFTPSAPR